MISVDYALRIYTDMLNSNSFIDLDYFKKNLKTEDFTEFQELIPFINLLKSTKTTQSFENVFDKINQYKENLYNKLPSATNFRSEKDSNSEIAKKCLDQLFDEEFSDD